MHADLIFKSEDIRRLIEEKTDFIVIRAFLEAASSSDGTKIASLKVEADAINKGEKEPVLTISGCPRPPCTTG